MRNLFLATAVAAPAVLGLVIPNGQEIMNPPKAVHADILDVPEGFSIDLSAKRLVQFSPDEPAVWMTELDKITAKAAGKKFFDITDAQDLEAGFREMSFKRFPPVSHQEKVNEVIKTLSTDGPRAHLEKFTSFRTRYYRSETGRQSQEWLLDTIRSVTAKSAAPAIRDSISIAEFPHSWGQNSIIVRINGSEPSEGSVIISAHQDSTNMWPFLPAPGADDDGSGTVTILETYRALIASGFTPKETVEFHWYSAEEGGLLGSQAVAKDYKARSIPVKAMSQFDMTAFVKKGTREEVGIITDFVDPSVTDFNKELVDEYLSIPYVETKCGYACSDHSSWSKAGYRSSFTIESSFENSNHAIHSTNDRYDIEGFSFEHMLEFSKLAVGFAIELGGWA